MFIHEVDESKVATIPNIEVQQFYALYLAQRRIIVDFYERLPEDQYDYRMVDTEDRRSDSPCESLAHIIDTHMMYFDAIRRGELVFESAAQERLTGMEKPGLLAELDELEREFFAYLGRPHLNPDELMQVPWGEMRTGQALHLIREHDILHIGWNLALMDHLDMARFPSLVAYWG